MRSLALAAILLTALLPLPGAAAQPTAEDPQGDTQIRTFGVPSVPAGAQGEAVDLLSLEVQEDPEEVVFILTVANLQQVVSFSEYAVTFEWDGAEHRVVLQREVLELLLDENTWAYLVLVDEDGDWDRFADLEHTVDVTTGTLTIVLPKAYILDGDGSFPLLGDELEEIYVEASAHYSFFQLGTEAYDRMPDEDAISYAFLFGDAAAGHLRLDATERVRVSNGGATTFVYQALVQNLGEEDDMVDVTLTDLPEGWNGTVQSPLRVPAGAEKRIAILMSVPFAHEHGGFSSFNVTATSQTNAGASASVRLGVLHTPIPQPAGHHQEIYLHSRNLNGGIFRTLLPFTSGSMNTAAEHEGDAPEVAAQNSGEGVAWYVPLEPALRMGLDFDLDGLGEIAGSIVGHTSAAGTLSAELLLMTGQGDDEGESTLLAESDRVPMTLELNSPMPFKLTITPTAESDYVAYRRDQNMMLVMSFEPDEASPGFICCIEGTVPALQTADFLMKLPLNEYHDRLTGLGETESALSLRAEGPVEKAGLPGTTMTYAFTLTNHGGDEEIIDLDLAGTDALLGTLVPAESVTLGAREKHTLTLAVSIPTDKNEGEELEVLVFAHAREDPSKSAIARTKTLVARGGSTAAVPDESDVLHAAQLSESQDTPAPGAALALGALALVALAARGRRAR